MQSCFRLSVVEQLAKKKRTNMHLSSIDVRTRQNHSLFMSNTLGFSLVLMSLIWLHSQPYFSMGPR